MLETDLLGVGVGPSPNPQTADLPFDNFLTESTSFLKCASELFGKFRTRTQHNWEEELFRPLEEMKRSVLETHLSKSPRTCGEMGTQPSETDKLLERVALIGLEQDYQLVYLGCISYCDELLCSAFNRLGTVMSSNNRQDFFSLHQEILETCASKHSQFVSFLRGRPPVSSMFTDLKPPPLRGDPSNFELHMAAIVMEAIAISESAKTVWLELYSTEEFHDWLDIDLTRNLSSLQDLVVSKVRSSLNSVPCLKALLSTAQFDGIWLALKKLVKEQGAQIHTIYQNTGNLAHSRLVSLDKQLRSCKLLPPHFIVAGVARLRARLQKDHGTRLREHGCLLHAESKVLEGFWREAVRGFGVSGLAGDRILSSFRDIGQENLEASNPTVWRVQVLLRENGTGLDSNRRGLLLTFEEGAERVAVLQNSRKSNSLVVRALNCISHRWKVVGEEDLELASLQGLRSRSFRQVLQMIQSSPRIWDSSIKELKSLSGFSEDKIRTFSISPLGRLLEDLIFSRKSLEECMRSFNLNGGSSGMMSFVMMQIPIVGGTIYTVMEFYGLGKILKSNHVSKADKVHELLKKLSKVGFTMGAVFSSSIVGQIVIPVPVVGALVGGLVGGIVGKLFGDVIDSTNPYPPMKFSRLCKYLLALKSEQGHWDFDEIDPVKHVMARWCTLTRPKKIKRDNLWLTMMCFLCLTLYHSLVSDQDEDEMLTQFPFHDVVEDLNRQLEPTILYLARHVDILNFEKQLQNGIQTLSTLRKEGYIKMDMKPKPE